MCLFNQKSTYKYYSGVQVQTLSEEYFTNLYTLTRALERFNFERVDKKEKKYKGKILVSLSISSDAMRTIRK